MEKEYIEELKQRIYYAKIDLQNLTNQAQEKMRGIEIICQREGVQSPQSKDMYLDAVTH